MTERDHLTLRKLLRAACSQQFLHRGHFRGPHAPTLRAALLAALASACIALPIPHPVTEHGVIHGQVVDDDSGQPLPGVLVCVGSPGDEPAATTDEQGCFVIPETEAWRLLWVVPLLPIDPVRLPQVVSFVRHGAVDTPQGPRVYRDLSLTLGARQPTRIVGDRGDDNRGLQDDLGLVRMKLLEPPRRN
jgi:hypothetical protein